MRFIVQILRLFWVIVLFFRAWAIEFSWRISQFLWLDLGWIIAHRLKKILNSKPEKVAESCVIVYRVNLNSGRYSWIDPRSVSSI